MRKGVFIFFLFPAFLWAQDIHFTQWMHNALFSNPAQSGFFEGTYRIHAQQRSQWASVSRPYTTTSLGMDMLVKNIGLGGQLLLDKAGTSRLRNTQFTVSGAYEMAGWRGGLKLGFVNRGIDYSDLQFPDQNESIPSESKSYVDLGLGVLKSLQLTQDKSLQLGMAMHHLNSPNTSFSNFKDPLPMRHQLQAQMQWELSEYWQLLPSLRYQQQSSSREMQWGTHLALDLSEYYQKEIEWMGGALFRWGDAASILLGAQIENSRIAFTYDWNLSDLVPASNGLGAWEISFTHILKQQIPKRPAYQVCPVYL